MRWSPVPRLPPVGKIGGLPGDEAARGCCKPRDGVRRARRHRPSLPTTWRPGRRSPPSTPICMDRPGVTFGPLPTGQSGLRAGRDGAAGRRGAIASTSGTSRTASPASSSSRSRPGPSESSTPRSVSPSATSAPATESSSNVALLREPELLRPGDADRLRREREPGRNPRDRKPEGGKWRPQRPDGDDPDPGDPRLPDRRSGRPGRGQGHRDRRPHGRHPGCAAYARLRGDPVQREPPAGAGQEPDRPDRDHAPRRLGRRRQLRTQRNASGRCSRVVRSRSGERPADRSRTRSGSRRHLDRRHAGRADRHGDPADAGVGSTRERSRSTSISGRHSPRAPCRPTSTSRAVASTSRSPCPATSFAGPVAMSVTGGTGGVQAIILLWPATAVPRTDPARRRRRFT